MACQALGQKLAFFSPYAQGGGLWNVGGDACTSSHYY